MMLQRIVLPVLFLSVCMVGAHSGHAAEVNEGSTEVEIEQTRRRADDAFDALKQEEERAPDRDASEPRVTAAMSPCVADSQLALIPIPFGFDLVPFAGTSSVMKGRDLRKFSLNLFGGYTGAVDGIEMGWLLNIDLHYLKGLQFSGVANYVGGPVNGAQLAGAANINRDKTHGAQLAGSVNLAVAGLKGAQLAGVVNLVPNGGIEGAQLAGAVNFGAGHLRGAQGAGAVNVMIGDVHGAQLAGAVNVANRLEGFQAAGALNLASEVNGGAQISGAVNATAGEVDGAQIGVINVAKNADAAIGVLNIMWDGRFTVDMWSGDTGLVNIGLRNGARYTHNILMVGLHPSGKRQVLTAGLGYGLHLPVTKSLAIDVDVLGRSLYRSDLDWDDASLLGTVRTLVDWRVASAISLFVAPAYNVLVSEEMKPGRFSLWETRVARSSDNLERDDSSYDPNVYTWPGFEAGIRLHFN